MSHNNRYQHTWTAARTEHLIRLWTDGWSATECAKTLGCGLTRNSVIGKINRLGLVGVSRRFTSPHPGSAAALPPSPKPRPRPKPPAPPLAAQFVLGILDLQPDDCRWPSDEGPPYTFCARPKVEGSAYCADHNFRAHHKTDRKDDIATAKSLNKPFHFGDLTSG